MVSAGGVANLSQFITTHYPFAELRKHMEQEQLWRASASYPLVIRCNFSDRLIRIYII